MLLGGLAGGQTWFTWDQEVDYVMKLSVGGSEAALVWGGGIRQVQVAAHVSPLWGLLVGGTWGGGWAWWVGDHARERAE